MNFHSVILQPQTSSLPPRQEIRSDAPLADAVFRTARGESSFLLVHDEAGSPIGVISMEDVLQPPAHAVPDDFAHWLERPVESALAGRLRMPNPTRLAQSAQAVQPPLADTFPGQTATVITRGDEMLGLMTDDDFYVSWRAVRSTLRQAQGDFVTGRPGRGVFEDRLRSECGRAIRSKTSLAVILADLDGFKFINDEYGHAVGDLALKMVGDCLQSSLRSFDVVFRYGGDEFAALCSGCGPGEIDCVVTRVLNNIGKLRIPANGTQFSPAVSIGASVAHDVGELPSSAHLVNAADACLYAAKNAGRGCAWKNELFDATDVLPVPVACPSPI